MLVVAVIAGLAAVVLAARWMQLRGSTSVGQVAVAQVDIPVGGRISTSMVMLAEWPSNSMPEGAFHDIKLLDGRVTRTGLQRGEPVTESRLAAQGTRGGLSAVVAAGKRAMTVRVNDVVGVAGFALPGSFVDVMVNMQTDPGQHAEKTRSVSKIVLERILVLAVGQEADRDNTKPNVVNAVTLELTPEQAEKLDLARSVGTLSLVLRNETDPNPVTTAGATADSVLGIAEPAAPTSAPAPVAKARVVHHAAAPAAPQPSDCVVMIRGGAKVTECF